MNLNKKIAVSIGSVVLAIAVGVPAVLLFGGISQFSAAVQGLESSVGGLRGFYKKNPFPSPDNIKLARQNVDAMEAWFDKLLTTISRGQVSPADSTPSGFMTHYNQKRNELIKLAGSVVPGDFTFGFRRYSEGALPAAPYVARLTQQLDIIGEITRILVESKVKTVVSIDRDQFEAPPDEPTVATRSDSRRQRPGAGGFAEPVATPPPRAAVAAVPGTTTLYGKQQFGVTFTAKEAALREVLNRLASHDMFIVVTSVEVSKTAPDLKLPGLVAAQAGAEGAPLEKIPATDAEGRPLPRQERMVSDPSLDIPMAVKLVFDVYTFTSGSAATGEG